MNFIKLLLIHLFDTPIDCIFATQTEQEKIYKERNLTSPI